MTEIVEVTVFPGIEDRVIELSQKLEQIATSHAPEAWEATLLMYKAKALSEIAMAGSMFLVGLILALGAFLLIRWGIRMDEDEERVAPVVVGSITGLVAAGVSLGALVALSKMWNWMVLSHPEIALAAKILG